MGNILILLAVYAGIIMSVYFVYVVKILSGKALPFEMSLLEYFVHWLIANGLDSRWKCWSMLVFSFLIEITYLIMVLWLINNPAILFLTIFLITFEVLHVCNGSLALRGFFKSQRQLKNLFNWRLERSSALFFFTHTLLVLAYLFYFQGFA